MNQRPDYESREKKVPKRAVAIRRGPRRYVPEQAADASRPPLAEHTLAWIQRLMEPLGGAALKRIFKKLFKKRRRKLQLLEMQQLGEKRFVAIVRVGRQKFLIGGAATSVSLLAEVGPQRATAIAPRPFGPESA